MGKKVEQQKENVFTDMAEEMEKASGLGKFAKMLDQVVGDVRWGRKSLAALTIGFASLSALGVPGAMNALLPYIQANAFTALLTTPFGAGVIGGAFGMAIWGAKGIGGTINAGVKTFRKNKEANMTVKQKAKRLKKSVGKLPRKDPTKPNIDSDKFILRNGVLMAVAEDAQGKNIGIRLMPGVTAISRDAFKWDDMDKPLTMVIPESVLALNLEGMPHNTRLIFNSPMSKYELLDDLKYDPALRKHVLGESKFDIQGGTYQRHLYECELLEEETPRPVTRWPESVKEDLAILRRLPEDKQRAILDEAYESMVKGGFAIGDFRNIVRQSTIPIQEFKGAVTDHCSRTVVDACKRQWYVNETLRLAKGNPAVTEMDALLKEIRRMAPPTRQEEPKNDIAPTEQRQRIPVRRIASRPSSGPMER